ncbi:MAG TPA: DNA-processing protein DprA, partial [Chitinophagaceae bacterium]|nr:DNA-processing protein DprA [Chitinophagaceae bacterium]
MKNDLEYQIALTLVPNIKPVDAKRLIEEYGDARSIFYAANSEMEKLEEAIGTIKARNIRSFRDFKRVEEEIVFVEKYNIIPLFITDEEYPARLRECYDPPTLLYYRGRANLNATKVVAVVGTRYNTEQGREITEQLVKDLSEYGILIVSGLAWGIDSVAHNAALRYNLRTVGVLGHGLDRIYPTEHADLAREILKSRGGLLTEFRKDTIPEKYNFPSRNRVVAGMSDAIIVVETDVKGGSMITAQLANDYNKDVYAYPGRITDPKSAGCNHLIRNQEAIMLTDTQQFIEAMNW